MFSDIIQIVTVGLAIIGVVAAVDVFLRNNAERELKNHKDKIECDYKKIKAKFDEDDKNQDNAVSRRYTECMADANTIRDSGFAEELSEHLALKAKLFSKKDTSRINIMNVITHFGMGFVFVVIFASLLHVIESFLLTFKSSCFEWWHKFLLSAELFFFVVSVALLTLLANRVREYLFKFQELKNQIEIRNNSMKQTIDKLERNLENPPTSDESTTSQ